MSSRMVRVLGALGLAASLGGCGPAPVADAEIVTPTERGKGGGEESCDPALYPCGPFGYQTGSIIENLTLVARVRAGEYGATDADPVSTIALSKYFQDKNIYVLLMTASAEWCSPCRAEQGPLREMYLQYKAAGGHLAILESIVQDVEGNPSNIEVADRWRKEFNLPFDLAADPASVLAPYYDVSAFPMNMVIRTSDMKIMYQSNGSGEAIESQIRRTIDAIIARPSP